MSDYPAMQVRPLPKAPHWSRMVGVGVVVMGLAIGTGELILWPHLVTKYGLGLLWAAFMGITFQYFINQEVARHTLATGESFFTSSARVFKWLAPFWLICALVLYIWPGWAGAMGTTLRELFGFGSYQHWAWVSLALVLVLTFSGRVAYNVLEKTLKIIVPSFFVLLVVAASLVLDKEVMVLAAKGLVNFGWVPENINIPVFLGAIVFAGTGGLLNLCVSLWYRDKRVGMARYVGQIQNPLTGRPAVYEISSCCFVPDEKNLPEWRKWMTLIRIDQGVIFWFLGFVTLLLLSLTAYAVLAPQGLVPEGTQVTVAQAHIFGELWGQPGFNLFLVMSFLTLFSVMWAILDAVTRIVSDILYVNAQVGPFQTKLRYFKRYSIGQFYYTLIVVFVLVGASLVTFRQPLTLLTISAVLGGLTMAIYTPLLLYLNNFRLARPLRPGLVTNLAMLAASVFYAGFAVYLVLG